jgi:hypothetical protein
VLVITAVMPGVHASNRDVSMTSDGTVMPALPEPLDPLPDATQGAPPFWGWYRFESDHPVVDYGEAAWLPVLAADASRGQYHRSEDVRGYVRFPFVGAGLRVRYAAARDMGVFSLMVDGQVLDTIDAYAPARIFPTTRLYTLTPGSHMLQIQPTGQKNPQSEGFGVGLDAIQVYRDDQAQIASASEATRISTPTPQIARVELIAAPPTVQPTPSPIPPSEQTVSLVIAYDENRNQAVDPAEGVREISARVLDAQTNRVLASGFTDASGYVRLQVITDAPARLVVPYFGETWELAVGRGSRDSSFTLLLAPGNQPGLIP